MTNMSYDYTYTDPSGYSYSGQVVSDDAIEQYAYQPGATYTAAQLGGTGSGTYTIADTPGVATTAPAGAVYMTGYKDPSGNMYPSYHYDPSQATYYNITPTDYDASTGMYTPANGDPPVPAWSGIGLGNEYSYVNIGTPTAPNYLTYGGGGSAEPNATPTYTAYDYQFMYPSGSYYYGVVVDNGTYGYKMGQTESKAGGTYTITGSQPLTTPGYQAGYNYVTEYVASGQAYTPSDLTAGTPSYGSPAGYGGLG